MGEIKGYLSGYVKCDLCSHIWLAMRHTESERLECESCENVSHFEPITLEDYKLSKD